MNATTDSSTVSAPRAFIVVLLLRVGAFGFAFAVTALIGRVLGDETLGRLGLLVAIVDVVTGLTGPALDATLVRFAAQKITPGHDGSLPYFQRMFRVKIAVALGVALCGALLARPILNYVIAPSAGPGIGAGGIVMAFVGAAVMTLLGFVQAWYQAHQHMAQYARIEFANTILRLVLVTSVLAVLPEPSAQLLLGVYVAGAALVTLGGYSRLPRAVYRMKTGNAVSLREPLRFARWVVIAAACTTVAQRIDIFLLGAAGTDGSAIGQYVAAFTLARLGDLAILTLFSVLLPRASALDSGAAYRGFLNRFAPVTAAALLAGAPAYFAAQWAVPVVFGAAFSEAGPLCGVLALGTLASLGTAPAGAALYGMGRSRAVAVLEALKLAGMVAIGTFTAVHYGVAGMAWTVTAVRATIGVLTYAWAYRTASRSVERTP